ncbi:hypothetical protein M409DRAFT_22604 [Zasmidium cellare ATCC 36951]|uniref:Transcription factor domain-containing protein n=1 Tax=Zasmidium cellare ATCC 36951 TaxID=1080233 RepID=A0A6A6CJ54_ZASCE|nr:uncharacterized protein M409DRAFT_22604 [Zasmidium cellare ATCC 36951]KAF2167175.1 hypothetical protein M409DRAFT_22604 [Zasmidium cellare ATCC 36951]
MSGHNNNAAPIRFIPQTGRKPSAEDTTTRKAIRRHVMLGKNRGRAPQNPRQPAMQGTAVFRAEDFHQPAEEQSLVIPPRVGTDLSFLDFADPVDPPLMNDTLRFCSATNENMFVLARCISFEAPDTMATCMRRLACDALYVNVMVFGTQTYLDQVVRHNNTTELRRSCLRHYGRALGILRERLAEAERRRGVISDITINSVIILGMHALATGQYGSARNHIAGLGRMMSLRERGLQSFGENKTRSLVDLLRCDISIALATGEEPILFPGGSCEETFRLPDFEVSDEPTRRHPSIGNDGLARIWMVLSRFCAVINKAGIDQTTIPERMLLQTMASVMYGLLSLSLPPDSTDKAIRLAMLSFCASTFLYWGQMRMPLGWLQAEQRRCLFRMKDAHEDNLDPRMMLWMLIVYGITFPAATTDEVEEMRKRLREVTEHCGLTCWDEVRGTMSEFLWIDIVCNTPAQELVEAAHARHRS